MNGNAPEQKTEFLSWKMAPARLNALQAAWYLGFDPHEIPILVAAAWLKPLGHPPRKDTKFFATETLEHLPSDEKWLTRASDAVRVYWRQSNARKRTGGPEPSATPSAPDGRHDHRRPRYEHHRQRDSLAQEHGAPVSCGLGAASVWRGRVVRGV